jgi:hypothetical protein
MIRNSFRQSWLHGTSEQCAASEIGEFSVDLLISASSWDCRCLCLTQEKHIRSNTAVMLEFDGRDNRGLRDKHDPALEKYLRSVSVQFKKIRGSSGAVEGLWQELQKEIVTLASRLGRPINILLDTSTFPRFLMGAVAALGLGKGVADELVIYYAEGVYERAGGNDSQSLFTGERWRFVPIPGLEGHYYSTKDRYFLVSAGFEGSKTLRYLSGQEPDRVSLLMADPGYEPGYPEQARANNAAVIEYFQIPSDQIATAHAADAVAAWTELSVRSFERFDTENVSYVCCGTKPHSLALVLRALVLGSPSVLYNIPDVHRVFNTVPTGLVWVYKLHDITKVRLSD